jgi:hypothetical protein
MEKVAFPLIGCLLFADWGTGLSRFLSYSPGFPLSFGRITGFFIPLSGKKEISWNLPHSPV